MTYQRDSLGRIIGIETQIAGVPTTLIEVLGYRADNQVTSQRFGNGLTEMRDYDAKGRLTNQSLVQLQSVSYRYDAAGNLLDCIATDNTQTYAYGVLDRLIEQTLDGTPTSYAYDANGNRLSQDTGTTSYDYRPDSNRLIGIDTLPIDRDAAGNRLTNRPDRHHRGGRRAAHLPSHRPPGHAAPGQR